MTGRASTNVLTGDPRIEDLEAAQHAVEEDQERQGVSPSLPLRAEVGSFLADRESAHAAN